MNDVEEPQSFESGQIAKSLPYRTSEAGLLESSNDNHAMELWRLSRRKLAFSCGLAFVIFYCFKNFEWFESEIPLPGFDRIFTAEDGGIVPEELLGKVYSSDDFINDRGIRPPFWDCTSNKCNTTSEWGPCYATHDAVTWSKEVNIYKTNPPSYARVSYMSQSTDLAGLCRPGFIIIGAGKCGTSSLYHYLVDHPKVLPASEKQIHYFKYYSYYPMKWYLSHFPTTTSFLASGALMTGEASPGYLPYPDVAHKIRQRLKGPKIIAVGREPIDRAYSSYRYNYVTPTIEKMKNGKIKGVAKGRPESYYFDFLFSFEDMIKAELKVLRECFSPDGPGIVGAQKTFGDTAWARPEFERRANEDEPPLVDLDGFCYGEKVNSTVLRKQWSELQSKHPEKVIIDSNLHLVQSFIGRSLYTFPLEWWYALYPRQEIYFICTEELSDLSGAPLNELGQFLGLPSYNFSEIVTKGAYNVGGHRGYDKEISWEMISEESEKDALNKVIPLSNETMDELRQFVKPYNERLFKLTGRRCKW